MASRTSEPAKAEGFLRTLTDFGFNRILSPGFIRVLYILGIVIILVNAVVMTFGSMIGLSGVGISINGFDGSEFFTSSPEISFEPNVANVLVSGVLYAVLAFIEIALLRVGLEMVAAIAATATAWQRIRRRSDAHPELIV
ncbi:DUF4282 domain-containing protein [Corynebacterium urealyticum]|uniref:DUF4282 domain-containing protein n=2 Tax=Corynebacterium urealyticum TaxID=43771 RepID=B1VGI1_CORU7|nr:DUF4282 domain-containing protein [Corynebacterium urealyticum]PZP01634.1 MAG: DUF4282 domain-containing protein [Corynebacterium urealyticum]QQC41305.1 DUF4282 domain-containing protein [Corynebacterium urealyticum]QQE51689.1 DUF4282 domain-containing protein [Corynebacterium urealyticum]TYR18679.1 DUF4282 domain-containing protein [Corynebacterium urealyticum]CAQ05288.1 hypothetical protein cu1328 [Corynebacterium urealyticum DSM 7109]